LLTTTLQVSQPPRSGSLRIVHDRVDQFSAADLQSGLVRYDHEDPDNDGGHSDDRFAFAVCVTSRCVNGVVDVRVTTGGPTTTREPLVSPTILSKEVVVDRALASVAITPDHLNTTCVQCPQAFKIIYSITSAPRHGHLVERSGRAENETLASFSQRDIALGHVIYQHVDSAHLTDFVQLSVAVMSRDGDVIWSSDVRLEIKIKPSGTEILLTVPGNISVVEGERAFITENQLTIQHGDDVDDVAIVVLRLPVYGRIQVIRGRELRARTFFVLSEVNAPLPIFCNFKYANVIF